MHPKVFSEKYPPSEITLMKVWNRCILYIFAWKNHTYISKDLNDDILPCDICNIWKYSTVVALKYFKTEDAFISVHLAKSQFGTCICLTFDTILSLKPQSDIHCNRSATSPRPKFKTVAEESQLGFAVGRRLVGDWSPTNRRLVADWSATGRRHRGDLFATWCNWSPTGRGPVPD